jgi:hypothetical protein
MPIPRERRVAILRTYALQANPYLAGVFDRLCADIAARDGCTIAAAEEGIAPLPPPSARTLEDYMRPTHREPGEEG